MREAITRKCDLLIENWKLIHKGFWLENGSLAAIAASAFAEKGQAADVERLKECHKILKKKEGIFSEFRGNSELIVSSKMALSSDPERYLEDVTGVYAKFQKGKVWGSSYRALAAMTICDVGKASEADAVIEKTNEIMKGMNKTHPFLTSDEDTSFAVLLAISDKKTEDILEELEEIYKSLKKKFSLHDNAVFSLSQVLASYAGNAQDKADKAIEIFDAFAAVGAKYGKGYELASLGTLIGLGAGPEDIASEVAEAADYLKGNRGFGAFDMGKATRLMFGTMIVAGDNSDENYKVGASVISGTVARVIAEQTAMMVAIMAASTSSATTSSSSN